LHIDVPDCDGHEHDALGDCSTVMEWGTRAMSMHLMHGCEAMC
jgi:hypothetical protein